MREAIIAAAQINADANAAAHRHMTDTIADAIVEQAEVLAKAIKPPAPAQDTPLVAELKGRLGLSKLPSPMDFSNALVFFEADLWVLVITTWQGTTQPGALTRNKLKSKGIVPGEFLTYFKDCALIHLGVGQDRDAVALQELLFQLAKEVLAACADSETVDVLFTNARPTLESIKEKLVEHEARKIRSALGPTEATVYTARRLNLDAQGFGAGATAGLADAMKSHVQSVKGQSHQPKRNEHHFSPRFDRNNKRARDYEPGRVKCRNKGCGRFLNNPSKNDWLEHEKEFKCKPGKGAPHS
jgi:hypothetical protein